MSRIYNKGERDKLITAFKNNIDFRTGYVYALFFNRSRTNADYTYVKIGSTTSIDIRIPTLLSKIDFMDGLVPETSHLNLVVTKRVRNMFDLESKIHSHFKDYLVNADGRNPFLNNKGEKIYLSEVFYVRPINNNLKTLTVDSVKKVFDEFESKAEDA